MRTAIQSFFFAQVVLEKAWQQVADFSTAVTRQYVRTPLQKSLRDLLGTSDSSSEEQLRGEVDGIRQELQSLRRDVRDLQKTPA
ncbi:MAG TPA: hypothetical protein V6C81_03885 [Planktothrix sp.]